MSAIEKQVVYDSTPAEVWAAITDPALIALWLMPNDFQPVVGRRFQLRAPPMPGWDGVIDCELLEIEPGRTMRWSWQGSNMAAPTEVRFRVEPDQRGARLFLSHDGFQGLGGMLLKLMHAAGWGGKFLDRQLRAVLAARKPPGGPE